MNSLTLAKSRRLVGPLLSVLLLFGCSAENGALQVGQAGVLELHAATNATIAPDGTVTLGPVPVGTTLQITATFVNTSQQDIDVLSATFTGPEFLFVDGSFPGTGGNCPKPIAPGATCIVVVTYTPPPTATADGTTAATLELTYFQGTRAKASFFEDYAADQKTVVISLAGNYSFSAPVFHGHPGDLDTTFASNGKLIYSFGGYDDEIFASVPQADGKVILVGSSYDLTYRNFLVVRLDRTGAPDPTFGSGVPGSVITSLGTGDAEAHAVALQTVAGVTKIVVAGYVDSPTSSDFALARYNLDGTLDTTFGVNGIQITDIAGRDENINSMVIGSDGKIVVAGATTTCSCGTTRFVLARYTVDGLLDTGATGFGEDAGGGNRRGYVRTAFPGFHGEGTASASEAFSLTLVPGTSELVAGGVVSYFGGDARFGLARYSADGVLSASFGSGGTAVAVLTNSETPADVLQSIRIIPTGADAGKILAGGVSLNAYTSAAHFALARFTASGALDTSSGFGTGGTGIVIDSVGGFSLDVSVTMLLQSDGKVVLGGLSDAGSDIDYAMVRYQPDGSRDTDFGIGGSVLTDFGGSDDYGMTLSQVFDGGVGKLVLSGFSDFTGGSTQLSSARYWQ